MSGGLCCAPPDPGPARHDGGSSPSPAAPPMAWLRSYSQAVPAPPPVPHPWVSPAVPLLLSQSETVLTTYEAELDWEHLPCARSSRLLQVFSWFIRHQRYMDCAGLQPASTSAKPESLNSNVQMKITQMMTARIDEAPGDVTYTRPCVPATE